MPTMFASASVREERMRGGARSVLPGRTRWTALFHLYQAGFVAAGWRIRTVDRPEIYQAAAARELLGVMDGDWHLAVKPLGEIRPFHGLPNLFVCDWEYPALSAGRAPLAPFLDQAGLLNRADLVLCTNGFTESVVRGHGVARTIVLPPPVPAPAPPDLAEQPDRPRRRTPGLAFLCILDADQLSRPLRPLLEGFAAARAAAPVPLRLLVRLEGAAQHDASPLWDAAVAATGLDRVDGVHLSFAPDPIDDAAALLLFAEADFFLSCSPAEGLPLPVIRAARAGLPVVATPVGGTETLLPPGCFVPITTETVAVPEAAEPLAAFMPLSWDLPRPGAVRDALLQAAALERPEAGRMAAAAASALRGAVGRDAFAAGVSVLRRHLSRTGS